MIIIASLIFDWMQALLDKLPNNMGQNFWILTIFIAIPALLIMIFNPNFFRFYMSDNGMFRVKPHPAEDHNNDFIMRVF